MSVPVYGIFEGGGAKGLGHVGGLKAAELAEMSFIGVAGASAGALIAALVAVGYRADDLFDARAPKSNLLTNNGITPLSLIGEKRWEAFKRAQEQAGGVARWAFWGGVVAAWLHGRSAVSVAREIEETGGYFTTDEVRVQLNKFLRDKLRQHHAAADRSVTLPEWIRFRDLGPAGGQQLWPECCFLKVIVTDVTNRQMRVFDNSEDYADVVIAEVVAASIAIPAVFKPARIPSFKRSPDVLYADGGLVSNLPTWVFAEEKLHFERTILPNDKVRILAFTLADGEPSAAGGTAGASPDRPFNPNTLEYWTQIGRTAVFGSQSVAPRFVADLQVIEMPVSLKVTQFDFSAEQALHAFNMARDAAQLVVVRELLNRPTAARNTLMRFHAAVTAEAGRVPAMQPMSTLRINLIKPFGISSFRVAFGHNMDMDADDRLVFSRLLHGAPVAFYERKPSFLDLAALRGRGQISNMTKYEEALVRPGLHSAICIPIFLEASAWQERNSKARPEPLGVVSIDSDADLSHIFNNNGVMQRLAVVSLDFAAVLQP